MRAFAFFTALVVCSATAADDVDPATFRERVRPILSKCVACHNGDELAGGLYGVALGRVFFGESMFSRRSNASKVALAYLARQLERWSFAPIDCQMATEHLASLGAREIPRHEFVRGVRNAVAQPPVAAPWRIDPDLMTGL